MNPRILPYRNLVNLFGFLILTGLLLSFGCAKEDDDEVPPPAALTLTNPTATPASPIQGQSVLFTVDAASPDGTVSAVTIDLTPLVAGMNAEPLVDNGTNGDVTAGDGTFSLSHLLDTNSPTGAHTLTIDATDSLGQTAQETLTFTVVLNNPPTCANGTISRDPTPRGVSVLITADAADSDGTIQSVTADLTDIGGPPNQILFDDGTNGDAASGDGTYSCNVTVSPSAPWGMNKTITFLARDDGQKTATTTVTFEILTNVAPQLGNPLVTPNPQVQRLDVLFTVTATDDTGLTSVEVDISAINGAANQAMFDDGSNGDATASDNVYSFQYTLPAACPTGTFQIPISATDTDTETVTTMVTLTVNANTPPVLNSPAATPDPTSRNQNVLFTVQATDSDGFVTSVTVDLTALGGTSTEAMVDDGTQGDVAAGDNTFSLQWNISATATVATHVLPVTATDDDTVTSTTNISLTVLTNVAPTILNPLATPNPQEVGLNVLLQVDATDDVAVTGVTADLTSIGGGASQVLYDDGSNGDPTPLDGTFSFLYTIPGSQTTGSFSVPATAQDALAASNSTVIPVMVNPNSPPTFANGACTPGLVQPGQSALLTIDVSDPHAISSVTADLSGLGRSATQTLYDDGSNGDATPSDGTYSYTFTCAGAVSGGAKTINVSATDGLSAVGTGTASLTVARFKMEHAGFLEDIHGTSGSNIYTVGDYSQVYRYDGSTWRLMDARPGTNLYWWAVWCESATSVWIGGASCAASHFDGFDWSNRDLSGASNYTMRAIWADGAGKVYAVGGLPGNRENAPRNAQDGDDGYMRAVWTNSTSSWSAPTTTTNGDDLNDIFGVSPTDFVAVGDDGLILHGNGTTWDASRSISTQDDLFGVWGYNDGTNTYYWAVAGRNSGTATPNIYYYSSAVGSWAPVSGSIPAQTLNLRGIYGSVSGTTLNAIYVVGTVDFSRIYGCVWESTDGQTFNQLAVSNPPSPYSSNYFPYAPFRLFLTDAWMDAGQTDVWVTGHRSIQHYDGSQAPPWTQDSFGTYEDTRAVDVLSATRAITWDHTRRPNTGAQISSIVHEYNAGVWDEFTTTSGNIGPALMTYTMLDPPTGSQPPIRPRMYAVKMFTGADVYGVGDDGHVFFWDGQNLTAHDFSSVQQYGVSQTDQRRLYALWGTSATDFWFGGEGNRIYHYQGTSWSTAPPSATILPGTARFVTSIWGASSTDIYAVIADSGVGSRTATRGNIYHYGGSNWSSIAGANNMPAVGSLANLNSLFGTSSTDVYVVGDGGFAMHWNGTTWSSLASALGNPTADLTAVFGDSSNSEVYIAGAGMRLWVKRGTTWYALRGNGSNARFMGGDAAGGFLLLTGTKGITLSLEK
ncbi:MAG: choice-of-anchor X domain-containing protein [Planctomycetota bacterium]|jgi:hypothetical protein